MIVRLLNRIGLTNWRRRLIAALVIIPVFGAASVEMTSRSWFCNSCHIMGPYYRSWQGGAHKDVECVKCHIDPGINNFLAAKFNGLGQVVDDVLHRTSMKPSASVSALACTRSGCHDMGKVRSTNKESGSYLFRHDKHVDLEYNGIQMACSTCHSHVRGTEHFEVNTNVCVTCHLVERPIDGAPPAGGTGAMPAIIRLAVRGEHAARGVPAVVPAESPGAAPAGEAGRAAGASPHGPGGATLAPSSCVTCHNPPAGTLNVGGMKFTHADSLAYGAACESCHQGATAVPVPIDSGQCYKCHDFGIERLQGSVETHRVHSGGEHKIECFDCHGTVQHGRHAQTAKLDSFDCSKCHVDQHNVQRRTYLHDGNGHKPGEPPPVSPMFLAHVDCTGCHVKQRPVSSKPDSGALVTAASVQGCNGCHRDGLGEKMIPLWQKTTRTLYDEIEAQLRAVEAGPGAAGAQEALAKVRSRLDQVRVDGSWGVHNPRYVQRLLQEARDILAGVRGTPSAGTP